MEKIKTLKTRDDLNISSLTKGETHQIHIHVSDSSLGVPWRVPMIAIRGVGKGPTLGITAAIHGNELNGISTIFKLTQKINPLKLNGNLIMIPISNVPGYQMNKRLFSDNVDLNRIMPGAATGSPSKIYAHHFTRKIISKFDYLLDLHTASHGRVNSLYIRADLDNVKCKVLAYLQNPQIIVKKFDEEGTLRAWANEQNIPALTIEIGNSNAFQHNLIDETLDGILNTMKYLKMISGRVKNMATNATICDHSYWIYSTKGGIVDVLPALTEKVKKNQLIAKVYDVFGRVKENIHADKTGIVIGKNIRPNCEAGTRILHLGVDFIPKSKINEPSQDALPW